jgi:hypothetical protein
MSWSMNGVVHDEESVDNLKGSTVDSIAVAEQMEFAKAVVKDAVESGVLGDPRQHHFYVQLNGHANPSHEPAPGWANDTITISITQQKD